MHSISSTKKRRRFSVSAKLVLAIIVCVVVVMVGLLWLVSSRMTDILSDMNEELLTETTQRAVQETEAWMNGTLSMLEAQRDIIEYGGMTPDQIRNYVAHTVNQNESYPAGLYVALNEDGSLIHATFVPGPDYDLQSKSWYQDGLKSESFALGDVYFDEDSQSYVVGASGVLKDANGAVRGVAAADVYLNSISKVVNDISIGSTGGVFIVDKSTDTIIGHRDPDLQGKILAEVTDSFYPSVEEKVKANAEGLDLEDGTYILTKSIPGTDWEVISFVEQSEVLADVYGLMRLMIIGAAIAVVIIWLLIIIMVRRFVGKPVKNLSQVATRIAEGDLDQKITYTSNDEIGLLAEDFNKVTLRLQEYREYINEISQKLSDIANGDLAFKLDLDYTGEFEKLKIGLEKISKSLNQTMGQIRQASEDVAAGAQQVATGATSLSSGSAKQATEVGSLATHITSMSDSVHQIAQGSEKAREISAQVRHGLIDSSDKMTHMTEVIQNISTKSVQINEIVKTIEDIAFQTNILALNAAVEAARAGESGKGFAVVADEVRVLAGKTSDAAQQTTALLSETVASMEEGVKAAQDTGKTLLGVVEQSDKMSELINGIAEYTQTQDENTQGITHGIDEISHLGSNNVNVAEQSAEASDELSGQAEMLKEMVGRFKLKEEDLRIHSPLPNAKTSTVKAAKKDGGIWMPPPKSKDHNSF